MRLVTWNCAMALHKKLEALWSLRPDVAVVQEVAEPAAWRDALSEMAGSTSVVYVEHKRKKGMAVLGFNGVQVELDPSHHGRNKYVVPIRVRGSTQFQLLAVWSFHDEGEPDRNRRPGPVQRALIDHGSFCAAGDLVLAGDFNDSVFWKKGRRLCNMQAVLADLHARNLFSAYHAVRNAEHGEEPEPTYWEYRKGDGRTYHIDFAFLPNRWRQRVRHVEVGSFEDWCEKRDDRPSLSDHVPLVVDVDDSVVGRERQSCSDGAAGTSDSEPGPSSSGAAAKFHEILEQSH